MKGIISRPVALDNLSENSNKTIEKSFNVNYSKYFRRTIAKIEISLLSFHLM